VEDLYSAERIVLRAPEMKRDREKKRKKYTREKVEITYRIIILADMTKRVRFDRLDLEAQPRPTILNP